MKMEQCSETSAYKIQTPGNHPKESIQHSFLFTITWRKHAAITEHKKEFVYQKSYVN